MDGVRLVRSEAPRCHPKDPLRPSKHEHRVSANDARHTRARPQAGEADQALILGVS
jgi:hypothetical protein